MWTRQYLEQQLRLVLAGRAAEELVYGKEELSSLHQLKLMMARQVQATAERQDSDAAFDTLVSNRAACKHLTNILDLSLMHQASEAVLSKQQLSQGGALSAMHGDVVYVHGVLLSLHVNGVLLASQIVHKMINAGFSSHPDFEHIRGLGTTHLDLSMEPNRWGSNQGCVMLMQL